MSCKYELQPDIRVDLRNKFPSIRDQGSRPLCLVFATSDLNTFAHSEREKFSVEYLAYHSYNEAGETDYSQGLTCQEVGCALEKHGQPHENEYPYDERAIKPTTPSTPCANLFYAKGKESKKLINELILMLDEGNAVVIITELTMGFYTPRQSSVVDDEKGNSAIHALVVVGYGRYSDDEPCFLIRNSWGTAWANNGYAWLTVNFITNKVISSLRLSKK